MAQNDPNKSVEELAMEQAQTGDAGITRAQAVQNLEQGNDVSLEGNASPASSPVAGQEVNDFGVSALFTNELQRRLSENEHPKTAIRGAYYAVQEFMNTHTVNTVSQNDGSVVYEMVPVS